MATCKTNSSDNHDLMEMDCGSAGCYSGSYSTVCNSTPAYDTPCEVAYYFGSLTSTSSYSICNIHTTQEECKAHCSSGECKSADGMTVSWKYL